jgi:hypothetical protein
MGGSGWQWVAMGGSGWPGAGVISGCAGFGLRVFCVCVCVGGLGGSQLN